MHRNILTILFPLWSAVAIALTPSGAAGALYRWVDSEGNVHYSDRLPPEESEKARTLLNERGIRVESVDAARTPEEVARDKALQRMRAEQHRLIEEQKAADRVLLRTFRSEDDITMTLNGKLAAIDVQILVIRSNIKRLKQKLAGMQKDAAALERQGKPISKNFLKEIETTRRTLKESYASIIRNEKQKERFRADYKRDVERFRKLKHLKMDQNEIQVTKGRNLILDRLFPCSDKPTCDRIWETAEKFARKFATTKIRMLSDTIIMTAPPVKDQDISITIARIPNKTDPKTHARSGGAQLFMDLQCKNSPIGLELCRSDKAEKIRSGFKVYMTRGNGAEADSGTDDAQQTLNNPASSTTH